LAGVTGSVAQLLVVRPSRYAESEDLIPYLAKTAHKLANLGLFWTVAAIVAQFLPPNAAATVEVIVSSLFLTLVGSIVVSAFLGGRGFDHPGSGFVLALAGFLLVHFVFGWDLRKPYGHADVIPGNSFYKEQYVTFKDHTEIFFAMLLNLCKVAVGMGIVAVPTLPIMWKLWKSRN
jgi:hypothetical protein